MLEEDGTEVDHTYFTLLQPDTVLMVLETGESWACKGMLLVGSTHQKFDFFKALAVARCAFGA